MKKIRAAVVGYGNIGHYALEALEAARDFEVAGIVRRQGDKDKPLTLTPYEVVDDIAKLKNVDVAILATPTRSCPEYAERIVAKGINTVDSFDIHTSILDYRTKQMENCKKAGKVSVIAAGWDPGSDSVVRVLTIPFGEGIHRRMVYVELEDGARLEDVTKAIKADPYFAHDETHVFAVASVDDLRDMGHGVHLIRKGVSGKTQNQRIEFDMSINNPALTGQILVNCARATMRLTPGCYTMPEIPVIDYLPASREEVINTLV